MDGFWEDTFPDSVLKEGRSLYKKGVIREISLNDDDAIMTCRFGKMESYSVVEWEMEQPSIRSSCQDEALGKAIAVAGLLEIEELLADEELSLIDQSAIEESKTDENDSTAPTKDASKSTFENGPTRMLHLVLDTHFKGLICEAYWLADDGSRVNALGLEDGAPRANTSDERGRLIVLAARARKSHFKYSPEFGGYLLENLREVSFFIQNVWPSWKKWFSTEERENVVFIKNGIRELKVTAKVSLKREGSLDVQWLLDEGAKVLDSNLAAELLARAEEPALIPELGIVKLVDESQELIRNWRDIEADASGEGEPYRLFSLFADGTAPIVLSDELEGWRQRLLAGTGSKGGRGAKSYLSCLRPYQLEGVRWMAHLLNNGCHCLLADEMGLGKTLQVISLIAAHQGKGKRSLVVCPASVVPVWISEFQKFAPQISVGRFGQKTEGKSGKPLDISVISYSLLRSRIERVLREEFEYAVIDEAQFIKNPDSKASRSCRRIKARRRIALTGTPIENRPLDIWPTFQFLMPGLLGRREEFESRFSENPGAFKARLRTQIAPFMLRRTKQEVAKELPEKVIIDQECPVTTLQAREYSRICNEGLARLGNDIRGALRTNRFATLSLLTRLRQVSCDPHLLPWVESELEDSGKLMVLLEKLIEVLGTGHKVVIFSQFVRFLKRARQMVEESFPELPIFELTGSTENRERPVQEFQDCKQTAAMLVSLKAASVGITLHSADYVFLLDPWWNPAVESQAIDRVHRIGQTNTVFVYRMIAKGTIEEKIQELQRQKRELFDAIVGDSDSGLGLVSENVKSLEALLTLAQSDA